MYHVAMTASAQVQLDKIEAGLVGKVGPVAASAFIDRLLDDAQTLDQKPERGHSKTVGGNTYRTILSPRTNIHIAYDIDVANMMVYLLDFFP